MIKNIENKITKNLQRYNLVNFFRFFSSIIEPKKIIIFSILLYKFGYTNKKQIVNYILGIITIIIIKNIIKRKRPFKKNTDIINYDDQYFDEYSFPSGHSFTAFYFSFMLSCNIQNIYLKNILIISSSIIALSRVYLGVHYLSDVT